MKNKKVLILFFVAITNFSKAQGLGEWTWMKGSNLPNSLGNFGTQGVSAPTNNPPALYEAYEWTDLNGNFWLFGGSGQTFDQNTLWKFDPLINNWTWIRGSSIASSAGIYGIQGVPSPNNDPGARGYGGLTWIDNTGDLWLFGGFGYDAFGALGTLNDLWRYNIASNQWTWMKGSNTISGAATAIIGIKGIANMANTPNGRQETNAGVTDALGNLWLFGGYGVGGSYNDVWKYNIATNMWTWIAGNQLQNNSPNYGIQQVSSSTNDPGGRFCYTKFIDYQNNIYFLGATLSAFNGPKVCDVWRFSLSTTEWTWVGGTNALNTLGSYINTCDTLNLNSPMGKFEIRATWPTACGFFFFGGYRNGASLGSYNAYNDLWYYNIETNKFTWASGTGIANNMGSYGTMGVSLISNLPRARGGALAFKDNQANLWLFGGATTNGSGLFYFLDDLWRYKIDTTCITLCSKKNPPIDTLNTNYIPLTITIPNVFTPNGDATNNNFIVKVENYKSYHLAIYDRWGLKLFETADTNLHWNGKPNNIGADCPDGTYYYIINLIDKGGKTSNYKGFLSLFR